MVARPMEPRFWSKVEKTKTCWLWRGAKINGYGRIGVNRKMLAASRLAYTLLVGAIPKGAYINHLCKNTVCVNPKHLEAITPRENILRGLKETPWAKRKGTVNYESVHRWLHYNFGKADKCENKGCVYPRENLAHVILTAPKKFTWALLHRKKYEKVRSNFIMLCMSCHKRYDIGLKNITL